MGSKLIRLHSSGKQRARPGCATDRPYAPKAGASRHRPASVFNPVCAKTIARFEATSDLPSDGIVLVTASTWNRSDLGVSEMLARKVRNPSAALDWGCKMSLEIAFDDAVGLDVGNVAKERQAQVSLNVILALNRIVQVIDKERQTDRQCPDPPISPSKMVKTIRGLIACIGTVASSITIDIFHFVTARQVRFFHPRQNRLVNDFRGFSFTLEHAVLDPELFPSKCSFF